MASNYTEHYSLCQWEATDQVLRGEFNEGYAKIDAALKEQADDLAAEISAREQGDTAAAEANCFVKLLDLTLDTDTQKWDIDMSKINLTKYQKLLLYPHLIGNTDQWAYFRFNQITSGYFGPGNNTDHCGQIPMLNNTKRQNFGVCEYTLLIELPRLYMLQVGMPYSHENEMPVFRGCVCPELADGSTYLDTLNLWLNNELDQIQAGSCIQIYGLHR